MLDNISFLRECQEGHLSLEHTDHLVYNQLLSCTELSPQVTNSNTTSTIRNLFLKNKSQDSTKLGQFDASYEYLCPTRSVQTPQPTTPNHSLCVYFIPFHKCKCLPILDSVPLVECCTYLPFSLKPARALPHYKRADLLLLLPTPLLSPEKGTILLLGNCSFSPPQQCISQWGCR